VGEQGEALRMTPQAWRRVETEAWVNCIPAGRQMTADSLGLEKPRFLEKVSSCFKVFF